MDMTVKIDRQTLETLIDDLEKASNIINLKLKQLYALVGKEHVQPIGLQKNEIKQKIDSIRQQVMNQVKSANIPNIGASQWKHTRKTPENGD